MNRLSELGVRRTESVRTALEKLCVTGKRILLVLDDGKLAGVIADGDIRRYLLKGGSLDASVENAANFKPMFLFDTERRNAENFLQEKNISAVPIVDENMMLLDVVCQGEAVDVDGACLRVLEKGDLPMVLEFFDQMAGDTRAMFNRGDVNRIRVMGHLSRKEPDNQIHFAATFKDADGFEKMVGYVFLWDLHTLLPWLGIAVREDWKGHHLGRRLINHVDAYLRPKGYGGVMLTSVPANVRAHSLYTRMGFEYYGIYPDSEFLYIKRYASKEDRK